MIANFRRVVAFVTGSKVANFPMFYILGRLEAFNLPDDKVGIIEYLEKVEAKLEVRFFVEQVTEEFRQGRGTSILVRHLKDGMKDKAIVEIIVSILGLLLSNSSIVLELIQAGCMEYLDQAVRLHPKDEIISVLGPKVAKDILTIGSREAISEIKSEADRMQLCHCCQLVLQRNDKINFSVKDLPKLPRVSERINNVCYLVSCYEDMEDVLAAGLDAIIVFARNADAAQSILETTVMESINHCVIHHPKSPGIIWRAAQALAILSQLRYEVASAVVYLDLHNIIANLFTYYDQWPLAQQQILWLLNSLLLWPRSSYELKKSEACMKIVRTQAIKRANLVESTVGTQKERLKQYQLVLPLGLRTLYRETGGQVYVDPNPPKEEEEEDPAEAMFKKKRKTKDTGPAFGTVQDVLAEGDEGLLTEGQSKYVGTKHITKHIEAEL